jgi:hypothetical protein
MYESQDAKNPKIRQPDITVEIPQVCIDWEKTERFTIYPNEVIDLAVTTRALGWDNTTELEFLKYSQLSDNIRISYTGTGTAPTFRTNRAIGGGADTEVSVERLTPYVIRINNEAGTAWSPGSIQPNDILKIEKTTDAFTSPFSAEMQGRSFVVQSKGADYIDVIDNGEMVATSSNITLGADYEFALRVFSPGPVKIGDTIELSGAGLHPSNVGKFIINDLSYDYVEITNPFGVDETVLYGTNSITIYDRLIGFIHARSVNGNAFKIRFGDSSDWISVERIGPESVFFGSVKTFRVQASNDGPDAVTLTVNHATVL